MELSPVFLKLFPVTPGSQTPQVRIPRGQYGYPIPLALRPYAGPPQGIPFPDALSMLMLRSNHAAHVNRTAHSSHKSSRNFEIHTGHPLIRNVAPSSNSRRPYQEGVREPKRSQQNNKNDSHRRTTRATMSSAAATASIIPTKTVCGCFHNSQNGVVKISQLDQSWKESKSISIE
uniref:Ovule protein n=1 Tax=Angiostrongylus cantonensis TaxID=6313 RepID=A0A0K0D5F7_ANGCA